MPGVATAQLLTYAEIVDVDLDATNDVNFADVEDYGHRVLIDMNSEAINNYLGWQRNAGSARPSAKLNSAYEAAFKSAIEAALSDSFVDIDGVTGGLHFGTANFDTNTDPRKRSEAGVSANDIPMCFVLYKLYGSSAVATLDNIFNLQDAHGMLSNATVSTAIAESFKANEAGSLDTMFRDLLAADPHRFFDASGIPITGIFETNADISGAGSWNITGNDIIEVKLKLIFQSTVSRRGVAGREQNLSSPENATGAQENQQTVISPSDYFYVRLQMKAIAPPAAPTNLLAVAGNSEGTISFTPGANGGKAITNYEYSLDGGVTYTAFSPAQTTSPVTITGLTNGTTYNIKLKAVNIIGTSAGSATVQLVLPGDGKVAGIRGLGNNDGIAVKRDAQNNVYVLGNIASNTVISNFTAQVGGVITPSVYGTISTAGACVVKYNSDGFAQWAAVMQGGTGTSMAVDSSGNVYVTGSIVESVSLRSFTSVSGGVINTSSSMSIPGILNGDGFLAKFNTNGQAEWGTNLGGASSDTINGVATDSSGNAYIIARANSSTINIKNANLASPSSPTTYGTLTNSTNVSEVVIVKYNSNGQVQWVTKMGNYIEPEQAIAIAVDSAGSVYITGGVSNSVPTIYNFVSGGDGGAITLTQYADLNSNISGSTRGYLIKYDTSGQAQWATLIGSGQNTEGRAITVDSSNNVYLTGRSTSTVSFYNAVSNPNPGAVSISPTLYGTFSLSNAGSNDTYLAKYNGTNGSVMWATRIAGAGDDQGYSLATDSLANVYIVGYYSSNPLTINSFSSKTSTTINLGTYATMAGSGYDVFIIKYNSSGVAQWATSIGGAGTEQGYGVEVDSMDTVYVTGLYASNPVSINTFGSVSDGVLNLNSYGTLENSGGNDMFVVKYNSNGGL